MPWAKSKIVDHEEDKTYSFDITKADKIFDYLLEKGQIKLIGNHKIPSVEELKKSRYCKYQNSSTHTTNDCKVFRELIQKAIEKGRIGLEKKKGSSMGIEVHPFPTNMVAPSFP
jgi:beta-xylosidase